jgi:hypothetical protein
MTQGTAVGAFIEGHQGRLERPAISSLYRAALLCVAMAMVILPVLYLALAAFAGWSVYELDRLLFDSGLSGRAFLFAFLGINGGLGVAVVFMFKPLFARRIENAAPYALRRTDQPLLFDFVDHLCDRILASVVTWHIQLHSCDVARLQAGQTNTWSCTEERGWRQMPNFGQGLYRGPIYVVK